MLYGGKVLANYVERGGGETGLFILKLFTLGIVDGAKFRERGGREETEFETARERRERIQCAKSTEFCREVGKAPKRLNK